MAPLKQQRHKRSCVTQHIQLNTRQQPAYAAHEDESLLWLVCVAFSFSDQLLQQLVVGW
jgi:hypothetical protein